MAVPYAKTRRTSQAPQAGEDGDFVQLRKVREQRKISQESKRLSNLSSRPSIMSTDAVIVHAETPLDSPPKERPSTAKKRESIAGQRDQMFAAVDAGEKEQVASLLSSIKKVEKIYKVRHPETNYNVLHHALHHDQRKIAFELIHTAGDKLLLSHHVIHQTGITGSRNALHIVTEKHDIELSKYILNKVTSSEKRLELMKTETAVDIQGQRPRLFSCLLLAAYYGHTDMVRLYLDAGMDVNHPNGKNDTALLWASRWGHNDTVNLLLDRGADPDVENDKGSTALYWAIRYEYPRTVELLLKKGKANPNTTRKLGLVAPIIVAAAYGNTELLSILLQHPATDFNIRIRGGEMPIHHAAREGCAEALEMLVKRGALFDEQDELGDTPLLLAAQNGHDDIVHILIKIGANVNHRNHEGHDVWYFAIENDENELLQTLVISTRGREASWRLPLCIAAANGRCDKVEFLLSMNLDPKSPDPDGNTFLHHAAMTDKHEVIEKFNSKVSINSQNNKGNTPLHMACFRGFNNTISSLLKCKAKADVKNHKGETALHVAAYSKYITANTVRGLIEYTINTHAWESLNAKDFQGNNSLHIAGKFAKPDVLWEFRFVRFKDRDQDGLTPLHEAVRPGEPEALEMMLDIFESMKRDARINEQSYATSETVLHLAADQGHAKAVKRLISLGADIGVRDSHGDTVLHRLTKACVLDHHNMARHLEVFDTIMENTVKWWCIKKSIPLPEEENREDFMVHKKDSTLFVLNDICNKDGMSVIDQAFKSGAAEILSRALMIPDVTMFEDPKSESYKFDITGLTPRTNNAIQGCCGRRRVAPLTEKDVAQHIVAKDDDESQFRLSGLEWLITHTEKTRAAEILDLPPIRMIERYYVSMVAWTFVLLMILHIVYMSVFTYVGVDLLSKLRNDSSEINSSDPETILLYAFITLEPTFIIVYVAYTLIRYCVTGDVGRRSRLSTQTGIKRVLSIVGSYMYILVCVMFAVLVYVWIVLFTVRYEFQDYFLAAAICIGWLLTISFTRGIRMIHYFYRMLISMIVRDIVRFIIVYLFVLMAFAFALHVLFQVSGAVSDNYSSPGDTLFLAFNLMIGMAELFDDALEENLSAVGRTTTYLKLYYILYLMLSTIILLNLLIAMMNDSYSMILKENQVTWRIESVSLGVEIESNFPGSRGFANVKLVHGPLGPEGNTGSSSRWYVDIPDTEYQGHMREIDRKYYNAQDAVTRRLEEMDSRLVSMERQTTQKLQQITELLQAADTKL